MFKNTPLILIILFSQTLVQTTSAQELEPTNTALTENDFFNEMPIVLSATRLKQSKKNSPTATTIIDREMIDASGFTEIADLLRLAPGMLVNYDSGHIANAGYQFLFDRYRTRFQVLIDGMSVYTPLFGEMPWTQLGITMDDIERIEVIRGPSSASYGPNAMTAVISIITRHAALNKGLKIKASEGVNGRSEQFATIGSNNGALDYRLSLAARKDDGFEKRYDDKDLMVASFRADYQATNNDSLTFSINHSKGKYQEDASDHLNDSMPQHLKYVRYTTQQAKWTHNYSDGDIFSLNYYQQYYDDSNTYIGDYTKDGYGYALTNESVSTDRKNIEALYTLQNESFNVTFGALYRKDNTVAPEFLYQTNKDIITNQLFINSEIFLNKDNIVNIGLLRDDNNTGGITTSPRISFNHHIDTHHTTRISYAESTRSPFIMEEYTNRIIYIPKFTSYVTVWKDLSDLKPEEIKTIDLGYIGTINNNATKIDLRIYKSWLTDLILQEFKIGSGFKQGDAFNITGFEATLSHKFKNTNAILNYAKTKITADKTVYGKAKDYETGAPEDNISVLLTHNFDDKLKGSLGYYYTSSYQQLCCNSDTPLRSHLNRVDLTLAKSFMLGNYNSQIKFVLQNVTNEKINTRLFNNYQRQGYINFVMEL